MSKNYAIIIQFVLPLTTFYRSGAQRSDVYKRDMFVTLWRFHNRAWQPQRHDSLSETSGTMWIHRGVLTNQRCSLATGCGIILLSHPHRSPQIKYISHKIALIPTGLLKQVHWATIWIWMLNRQVSQLLAKAGLLWWGKTRMVGGCARSA